MVVLFSSMQMLLSIRKEYFIHEFDVKLDAFSEECCGCLNHLRRDRVEHYRGGQSSLMIIILDLKMIYFN